MHRLSPPAALGVLALACATLHAQDAPGAPGAWTTPTIQGYGRIHMVPKAAYRPDPSAQYKIVFALTRGAKSPDSVNPALDRVARTINLYVASGVPPSHLKFVAVAYAEATPLALDDATYKAKFGTANPNLPLVKALRKAGVDIAVCAQAVAEMKFNDSQVDPSVTEALSGLTTITMLEQQGYVLMPL